MNTTKVRPLQDRVLIKRVEEEQTTKGGLIIPDSAKEKPAQGIVVSVGGGKLLENGKIRPVDMKIGDRVLFGKYAGSEIKVDGGDYLILKEDEILGVIDHA